MRIKTTISAAGIALGAFVASARAQADETIKLLYQPVGGFGNAYIAADQGFFAKHGLDVEFMLTQLASNVPAVIESGEVDIGGPTMIPILQADDNGLDLVAIAGGSVYPLPGDGVVAATGSGIDQPRDLKGKRIGVPGIGTQLQVVVRWGLKNLGIGDDEVKYLEVGFLQSADALKSHQIDAYTEVSPFSERVISAGLGKLLVHWPAVRDGTTTVVYTTTRKWAAAHAATVEAFRAALREAETFMKSHQEEQFEVNAKYTKLPIAVVRSMPLSNFSADLSAGQVQFWIDLAKDQHLIQGNITPKDILFQQ